MAPRRGDHLTIDTMHTGQNTVDDHIAALQLAASLVGVPS